MKQGGGSKAAKKRVYHEAAPSRKRTSELKRRIEISSNWQSCVVSLRSQSFATFEDALGALIDEIAKTLHATPEECQFLRVLLSTDPGVETALRLNLCIRS